MVRRTRKRSKNKKGGSSFMDKFKQGTSDIGKGLQDARAKAGETYAGASQGMKDFNEARKAQYQSKVAATGGVSLFGKKPQPQALPKQRRSPILPGQDPFARKNPIAPKPKSKKSDAFGRVSLETAQFMAHAGGKRKTRRKKRRKNKKRKTKKRRRKRKTKRRRRR